MKATIARLDAALAVLREVYARNRRANRIARKAIVGAAEAVKAAMRAGENDKDPVQARIRTAYRAIKRIAEELPAERQAIEEALASMPTGSGHL